MDLFLRVGCPGQVLIWLQTSPQELGDGRFPLTWTGACHLPVSVSGSLLVNLFANSRKSLWPLSTNGCVHDLAWEWQDQRLSCIWPSVRVPWISYTLENARWQWLWNLEEIDSSRLQVVSSLALLLWGCLSQNMNGKSWPVLCPKSAQ